MKKLLSAISVCAGLAAPLSLPVRAQEAGTVNIEAGEMEIIEADKQAIFRGNVVAKRASETIRAAVMNVEYVDVKQTDGTSKSEVDTMDCTGGVTITTPTQKITGNRALFKVRQNLLTVTGDVTVVQGKTVLHGPAMEANLKTKRTIMKGGVSGTFVPK